MNQTTQVSRPVNTPNRKAYGLFNSDNNLIEIRLSFQTPCFDDFNFSKVISVKRSEIPRYHVEPIAIHDALGKELVGVH